MKIEARLGNYFNGSYYGVHDEMDAKSAPLGLKLLFVPMILIIPTGVIISFYEMSVDNVEWFVKTILLTLAIEFPLIHIWMAMFDKFKYGAVRKVVKTVGTIFSVSGSVIILGIIICEFISFVYVLSVGLVTVFLVIGILVCVLGSRKLTMLRANCTAPVWAMCIGFDNLNPHMPILDSADATYAQNNLIARAEVMRPIWEFDYNGWRYRAVPEEYQGKQNIVQGKQYKIYINPNMPQQIYCEEDSDAKSIVNIGRVWMVFTFIIALILVVTLVVVSD